MQTGPVNYQFGEFTMDTARGCVQRAGKEIKLRPKVYEALKYLVEHPGRLIGKQELMKALWPDAFVTDDSLVQCTLELRRALNDRDQRLLKTVPRRGYIFASPVQLHPAEFVPSATTGSDDFPGRDLLPANRARKHYELPVPRTSLIGREQEVAEATGLLLREDVRLLTLTGPGGAGKTRLAVAVATAVADRFASVQFVNLASIMRTEMVATALADALETQKVAKPGIKELSSTKVQDARPFLLVLDNFEQLLPAATVVAETLEACLPLKILVTSRSRLRIYGEQEFPLAPLPERSAIELFGQRAAAVLPDFAITSENSSSIHKICSRLDGLPLAIELAAARIKVLSPGAILERLQSPLQLLTGGALDLPERQQTIRKTIDWSHSLLNASEQRLFRRFSVFAGGCTFEAAEAVCNPGGDLGGDLFETLSSLVDKNLIQHVDRSHGGPRLLMLETIREYASERLIASGEERATRRAHAAYCLVLAEEGNPELGTSDRTRWLALCDAEVDNFRSALDWLFQTRDLDWGVRLCAALFRFWDTREHLVEARARLETVLGLAGDERPNDRARLSFFIGALAAGGGDFSASQRFLEQSLCLYEELGDQAGIAAALNALAVSARDRGDYSAAQSNFERSLACWRVLSDRSAMARCLHNLANVVKVRGDYPCARWALGEATEIFEELGDRNGAAWSINLLGDVAAATGDRAAARGYYQRSLSAFRESGDPWGSARSLIDLGYIACEEGDFSVAHSAYGEALEIFTGLGHRRGIARALEGHACLAIAQGNASRALKLAAAALHLRQSVSAPLAQAEQTKLDQMLQAAWDSLSPHEGKKAWEEGSTMSMEKAMLYARELSVPVL